MNLSATGSHLIEITIFGASDSDTKRDLEEPWMVEIQNLVVTQPDSSASLSGSSSSATKAGSEGSLSAASTNSVPRFLAGFATILEGILFYM